MPERARAVLGGLKSQPELNGEAVELLGAPVDGRFPVEILRCAHPHERPTPHRACADWWFAISSLPSTGKKIKVKQENLTKEPPPMKTVPKPWEHDKNLAFLRDRRHELASRHKALVAIMEFIATGIGANLEELIEAGLVSTLRSVARDSVVAFKERRDTQLQHFGAPVTMALTTLASRGALKCGQFGSCTVLSASLDAGRRSARSNARTRAGGGARSARVPHLRCQPTTRSACSPPYGCACLLCQPTPRATLT
jgi:hypothetical protein